MNVAIAKCDFGSVGGFELVVNRLADGLRARGHSVTIALVDARPESLDRKQIPLGVLEVDRFQEFFFYLQLVQRFEALDLSAYDVVLCTQPGSFAVRHPRKVALFYHHLRSFYDLEDVIERTRVFDNDLHQLAAHIIRDIDARHLTPKLPILAGSRRVKERLAQFNGLTDNVEVFSCGIDESFFAYQGPVTFESPVCIGRHTFPKRTELFVHAMMHVDQRKGELIGRVLGEGEFTDQIKGMEALLRVRHAEAGADAAPRGTATPDSATHDCPINDEKMWLDDMIHMKPSVFEDAAVRAKAHGVQSPVVFLGRVDHDALIAEYARALCVVCPALDEDFGLTCIEAMALGKPVIACHDGGGYVELIDDGVDGFLVEPTGPAIGEAINRLRDVNLARTMGARGREKARAFTWEPAIDQLERALVRTFEG